MCLQIQDFNALYNFRFRYIIQADSEARRRRCSLIAANCEPLHHRVGDVELAS